MLNSIRRFVGLADANVENSANDADALEAGQASSHALEVGIEEDLCVVWSTDVDDLVKRVAQSEQDTARLREQLDDKCNCKGCLARKENRRFMRKAFKKRMKAKEEEKIRKEEEEKRKEIERRLSEDHDLSDGSSELSISEESTDMSAKAPAVHVSDEEELDENIKIMLHFGVFAILVIVVFAIAF